MVTNWIAWTEMFDIAVELNYMKWDSNDTFGIEFDIAVEFNYMKWDSNETFGIELYEIR